MKKATVYFYILMLTVLLVLPIPFWKLTGAALIAENHENRTLSERPELSLATLTEFPARYDIYLNDNMPFKQSLVKLRGLLDYYVFRSSTSGSVIVGKDGWLFYRGKQANDENPEADYMGLNLFSDEELEQIRTNMLRARDLLAERGTDFYIFIAPNKERVYAEHMPSVYGAPAEKNRMMQVVDYLRETTDLTVICPYDELMRFKNTYPEPSLYYKFDTHWNNAGSYIGAKMLCEAMGYPMPELEETRLTLNPNGHYDLAELIGLQDELREDPVWVVNDYSSARPECEMNEGATEFRFTNPEENRDTRKVFLVGDSFSTMMGQYIACHFNHTYLNSYMYYESWMLATENPDIFIYETVERYIPNMLRFDLTDRIGLTHVETEHEEEE